jgi:hypothetical protein
MSRLLKWHNRSDTVVDLAGNVAIPGEKDVIYFSDFFDRTLLDRLVSAHGRFLCLVTDVESTQMETPVPVVFVPALDMGLLNYCVDWFPPLESPIQTQCCFNFSINKKQPDRYCLLKLIEWFDLTSCIYTWSGVGASFDCTRLISEFHTISAAWATADFLNHLLSPVTRVTENWILPNQADDHTGFNRNPESISLATNQLSMMFSKSAVALIAEGATDYQPNFCFSEKTLMTMAALNFPIWVGSYQQEQQASDMGIDTFPDIVNHGYQHKNTLLERCYHAVSDNLALLSDLDLARDLRQQHLHRLQRNREHVLGTGIKTWTQQQIRKLPESVQSFIVDGRITRDK